MIRTRSPFRIANRAVALTVYNEKRTRTSETLMRVNGDAAAEGEVGVRMVTHDYVDIAKCGKMVLFSAGFLRCAETTSGYDS